jgi:hypothetical protein
MARNWWASIKGTRRGHMLCLPEFATLNMAPTSAMRQTQPGPRLTNECC